MSNRGVKPRSRLSLSEIPKSGERGFVYSSNSPLFFGCFGLVDEYFESLLSLILDLLSEVWIILRFADSIENDLKTLPRFSPCWNSLHSLNKSLELGFTEEPALRSI